MQDFIQDSMDPLSFKDNEYLNKVVLNEGLREIGMMAFEGCESLQKIAFPSTLRKVGPNAFRSSGLERVELNNGLEVIEGGAFVNCKSLMKSIEFPSTLKHVGKNAFYGCSSLKKIVLNEGLKKVDDFVFEKCVSLESINFPSTIRYIGANAFDHSDPFYNRSDLKEVVFNDGLLRIGDEAFKGCKSLTQVVVPSSVNYLGERAFYECEKLRKVVLNKVKTIDDGAFSSCECLKEVLCEEGLKEVGDESFSWCTSLERISFPSTLTMVGEKAFEQCNNLKEVTFSDGSNLKMIGKNVFDDCGSMERINIIFPRLEYIIRVGHTTIRNEINDIDPDIQCITKEQHWICKVLGRKNTAEVLITGRRCSEALRQVGQINKLIDQYELREAMVLFELALWKGKMEQADKVHTSIRGMYHIAIPEPVQEAILQYICPAKEAHEHRPIKRRRRPDGSVISIYDDDNSDRDDSDGSDSDEVESDDDY